MHHWGYRPVGLKRVSWIIIPLLLQSYISPYNPGSGAAARMPAAAPYVQVKHLSICFLPGENLTLKWLSKGRKHSCHHHHLAAVTGCNPTSSPPELTSLLDAFWIAAMIHFAAGSLASTAPPSLLWPSPHLSLGPGSQGNRTISISGICVSDQPMF